VANAMMVIHPAQHHCERSEAISAMNACASEVRLLRFARNDRIYVRFEPKL
jgi:hypothetical protein